MWIHSILALSQWKIVATMVHKLLFVRPFFPSLSHFSPHVMSYNQIKIKGLMAMRRAIKIYICTLVSSLLMVCGSPTKHVEHLPDLEFRQTVLLKIMWTTCYCPLAC